jgi:hypothetical protein
MEPTSVAPWGYDWMWSLPLIAITVVFHAFGLGFIDGRVAKTLARNHKLYLPRTLSVVIMGGTALFATVLHGFEAAIWASAYVLLGAVQGRKSAMLYSVSAMATYGHTDIHLQAKWQMMGALEALNGWILFGLTTAFLFTVIQKAWPQLDHYQNTSIS